MFKQRSKIFEKTFLKNQCKFRKSYSTQQCLLAMSKKWKRSADSGKAFGALLTDLSEAFDYHSHDLLVARLYTSGLSAATLRLIHDYLRH